MSAAPSARLSSTGPTFGNSTVWRPYCQMKTAAPPLEIVATDDCELIAADGRRLIDGMASWWSACHGYNHPHIVAAVQRQLCTMPHVMFGGLTHRPAEELAGRLAAMLPGDLQHVFYADSGSVAIEVAMKMAIGYWRRHGQPHRNKFLAFEHAYHGDTTGAMSLCDPDDGMHSRCTGAILTQVHAPLPVDEASIQRFEACLDRHADQLAAVFLEPLLQGAGGMRFHDVETVQRVNRACRERGLLWVADEIATGFGRTGSMFAIEQAGVTPDIICLGKALTAGTMTMAVAVAGHRVFDAFWSDDASDAFMHGPTFMANPLACAAANASLDLFQSEPRLAQVQRIESRLKSSLARCLDFPGVVDVRCRGAVGVVQMTKLDDLPSWRSALLGRNVWLRPFDDCLYTMPPMTITDEQLDVLCDAMINVLHRSTTTGFLY